MAPDFHALIYGVENAYLVRDVLEQVLPQMIEIEVYLDSRIDFNVITKSKSTLEKRLHIDVHALHEIHAKEVYDTSLGFLAMRMSLIV